MEGHNINYEQIHFIIRVLEVVRFIQNINL